MECYTVYERITYNINREVNVVSSLESIMVKKGKKLWKKNTFLS